MLDPRLWPHVVSQVDAVVGVLADMTGARTLWLDPYGRLWHAAPSHPAPHSHWREVGTFARPSKGELRRALVRWFAPQGAAQAA
ncbi:MAG: hypothetical protein K1X88_31245 [Nannocystaceae bacterium]|nr:hypothetical protein [Nannocystaceae bacterium]